MSLLNDEGRTGFMIRLTKSRPWGVAVEVCPSAARRMFVPRPLILGNTRDKFFGDKILMPH